MEYSFGASKVSGWGNWLFPAATGFVLANFSARIIFSIYGILWLIFEASMTRLLGPSIKIKCTVVGGIRINELWLRGIRFMGKGRRKEDWEIVRLSSFYRGEDFNIRFSISFSISKRLERLGQVWSRRFFFVPQLFYAWIVQAYLLIHAISIIGVKIFPVWRIKDRSAPVVTRVKYGWQSVTSRNSNPLRPFIKMNKLHRYRFQSF